MRALTFFGGVPDQIVPDNLKSGVTKAYHYDPDINESYSDFASHYGTAILPARSRKPKDKAKVETSVKIVGMWILARIRNEKFFTLAELNERIRFLLGQLNQKLFQKLTGCRLSVFEEVDKPALSPLPKNHYEFADIKLARVNIDYHIEYQGHFYSVPYKYVKSEVKIRATRTTIEILAQGKRIASHVFSPKKGHHSTTKEHMPRSHQEYSEWSPERLTKWAEKIGPSTKEVVKRIIESREHPEQGYRSSLGVLRLEKKFGSSRLEQACLRAINFHACSYKSIKSILTSGFDNTAVKIDRPEKTVSHENIRGNKLIH